MPGTYRTDGPSSRCYWALLAEFSNVKAFLDRSEAASNADPGPEIGADQVIVVQIGAGDAAFETIGMRDVAPRRGVGAVGSAPRPRAAPESATASRPCGRRGLPSARS